MTIDIVWPKAFRKDWRELQPILDEIYYPSDPRNRSNLHCTYLFGCVDKALSCPGWNLKVGQVICQMT